MNIEAKKSELFWHNWESWFHSDGVAVSVNWTTVAAVGAALFKLIGDIVAKDNSAIGADIMAIIYALGLKAVQVVKTHE